MSSGHIVYLVFMAIWLPLVILAFLVHRLFRKVLQARSDDKS